MESADDFHTPFLADGGRQYIASPKQVPGIQPFQKVGHRWIPSIEFAQHPEQSLVLQRTQFLDAQSVAERQLDGLGNHGARRNFGVVKIHPLGKRVADTEQVDELRKRVVPQHAVFFQVHDQSVVVKNEDLKNTGIVVLRKSTKISITPQVVEQIGADGAADDIRSIGLVAFQNPDHGLLQPFTFENSRYSRQSKKIIDSPFIFVVPWQNAAFIFESVSEWNVRHIVKKCRHSNESFLILRNRFRPADSLENAMRHP